MKTVYRLEAIVYKIEVADNGDEEVKDVTREEVLHEDTDQTLVEMEFENLCQTRNIPGYEFS